MADKYNVLWNNSTGAWVNDFQLGATEAVLIANAIANGLNPANLENRKLTLEEFWAAENATNSTARTEAEQARAAILAAAAITLHDVANKCKVTEAELIQMIQVYG